MIQPIKELYLMHLYGYKSEGKIMPLWYQIYMTNMLRIKCHNIVPEKTIIKYIKDNNIKIKGRWKFSVILFRILDKIDTIAYNIVISFDDWINSK